ncbi:Bulb-type lectin domain containing protein [Parasponia andersonii]|uniref:Bulb-type lectin domain containing protein n=1 Tax=Parasponia andersonii TaxID=3476 RepID=A0A2P5ARQ7_PARAD|nr:Bulb-type lectin domain containing protein [Parasponia andersonii]
MDGWKMTVMLSVKNRSLGFYFGLYGCEMTNDGYLLAVVAVGGGGNTSHTVVWSSDRNTIMDENSYALLSSDSGFVLVDDKVNNWALHQENEYLYVSVAGVNLTEEGNVVLFGNEGEILWQSFHNPIDTLLVGQRLFNGHNLMNYEASFAGLTKDGNFSVFINTTNRSLIYYQTQPDLNSRNLSGLVYAMDLKNGFVINLGKSDKSSTLEFIESAKLDSDGRLKRYRYENSREEITLI